MNKTLYLFTLFGLFAVQIACGQTKAVSENARTSSKNIVNANNSDSAIKSEDAGKPNDYFVDLKPEHKEILQEWLKEKSYLRQSIEKTDSILDENSLSDIHKNSKTQFYAIGDFNQDGKEDFAVLLIDTREKKHGNKFSVAIFNGDLKKGQTPNYYEENLEDISNCYLDFGGMDKNHLYLGVYEGDRYCSTYIPRGNGYKYKDCEE